MDVRENAWGAEFGDSLKIDTVLGLESFDANLIQQGPGCPSMAPFFKPVNVSLENGLIYATIYVSSATDGTDLSQSLAMWFSSLKATDVVHLTVTSMMMDIPPAAFTTLMAAINSTKAKIIIHLDTVVFDSLAYFYLIGSAVEKGTEGALYIPSYVAQRSEDMSGPGRAMNDYFQQIVEDAVTKDMLTSEEAEKLKRGSHVVVPDSRFVKAVS